MNKEAIIERQANENLKLVNDNKDLQKRIDKAIEYIENNELYEDLTNYSEEEINFIFVNDFKATKELLSILRGEE